MSTPDIVIITILSLICVGSVLSWMWRATDYMENLWIEPLVITVAGLLIYLVARGT